MQSTLSKSWRNVAVSSISIVISGIIWVVSVHLCFSPAKRAAWTDEEISEERKAMTAAQLRFWRDPALKSKEMEAMRRSNSEWDFMGRTFLALALAEMCERNPALRAEYLPVIDTIIDETLALEKERGMHFFLMPYSKRQPYKEQPERSLFIDGEIALMFATRVKLIEERLGRSALMAVESYPNECWLFDHAVALAALKVGDFLDRTDHSALCGKWVRVAKGKLAEPKTGIFR